MRICLLLCLTLTGLCFAAQAQAPAAASPPAATWNLGFGLGNGLEVHAGYYHPRWLAFGRLRGKWWGPEQEPSAHFWSDGLNTRSEQTEAAVLLGIPVAAGQTYFYAAAGLAYVSGRQLGDYRYSLRKGGLFSTNAIHYYAYRDYQAVGLPLEVGWQSEPLARALRLGVVAQANLNPQHSVYCFLATISFAVFPPQPLTR